MKNTYTTVKLFKVSGFVLTALALSLTAKAQSVFVPCDTVIDQSITSNNTICVASNNQVFSVPSQANMHYQWTFPPNVSAYIYDRSEIPVATAVPPLGSGFTPQSLFQVTSNMKFQIAYSAAELANTFGWKTKDVIDSLIFKFKSTTGGSVTFNNYRIVYYKLNAPKTWSNPLIAGVDVAVTPNTPGIVGTPVYIFGSATAGSNITMNVPNTGTGSYALKLKNNTFVWDGTSNIVLSFEYWNTSTAGMGSYVMYNESSATYNVLGLKCNVGATNINSVNSGYQISGYQKSLVTPFTNAGIAATGSPTNYGASTQRPRIIFSKRNTTSTDKNSISSNWAATAISGNVCVNISNNCDSTKICKFIIVPSSKPPTPGTITGATAVCPSSTGVYSIKKVTGADYYEWTPPTGASINGSPNPFNTIDTVVTVTFKFAYTGDSLRVKAINCKGASGIKKLSIPLDNTVPSVPGNISGLATGVCLKNNLTYKISKVNNATSYTWRTNINGALINGQANPLTTTDTAVQITFPKFNGGSIFVKANRCLSSVESSKLVLGKPAATSGIGGPSTVCKNQTSVLYKCSAIFGASTYYWILPTGATFQYGQGNDSILINFGAATGNKTLKVAGINSCDTGATVTYNINILTCPRLDNQNTIEEGINLFPNPVTNQFVLEFSSALSQNYTLTISDMPGRKCAEFFGISETGLNQQTIDVANLKAGIYFVSFEEGDKKRITKFIKQ